MSRPPRAPQGPPNTQNRISETIHHRPQVLYIFGLLGSRPPTPSPDPGPNASPKTSLRKSIKRKLKTTYNQSTPKVVRESQSPSTSQPHQSPSDGIEDDIATNNPRQFTVIQSNSPPSQTLSQDVLDEFNSSDF